MQSHWQNCTNKLKYETMKHKMKQNKQIQITSINTINSTVTNAAIDLWVCVTIGSVQLSAERNSLVLWT